MEQLSDEVSLRDIILTLRTNRRPILKITACFGVLGLIVALLLPIKYEASTLLAPVDNSSNGTVDRLGGTVGVLSHLSGLSGIDSTSLIGGNQRDESIATLQSAALTESFISDNGLLPVLFQPQGPVGYLRSLPIWPQSKHTLWKAEKLFREEIRSVDEDKDTGLVTLTIEWSDPKQAAQWANELVSRTNAMLRDRAIAISERKLAYLNSQLVKTSVVELQQAIYTLIDDEIKKVMVAKGSDEFAFKVIDPARPPEEKSSPKRVLIVLLSLLAGFLAGVTWVFVSASVRQ